MNESLLVGKSGFPWPKAMLLLDYDMVQTYFNSRVFQGLDNLVQYGIIDIDLQLLTTDEIPDLRIYYVIKQIFPTKGKIPSAKEYIYSKNIGYAIQFIIWNYVEKFVVKNGWLEWFKNIVSHSRRQFSTPKVFPMNIIEIIEYMNKFG